MDSLTDILDSNALPPRDRFRAAVLRKPMRGCIPHFELVYFLTMESFGKVHPSHRSYRQWDQMTEAERELHREDMARVYVATAERFDHDAILLHPNPGSHEEVLKLIDKVRELDGGRYSLLLHGDTTYSIPGGGDMMEHANWIMTEVDEVKAKAQGSVDRQLEWAERLREHGGLDGFALCSDYCFNTGPFLPPDHFAIVVAPYLKQLCDGYREMAFLSIKHTDGNVMPILDQLVEAGPDALHSLDPQGGVDIAEVKRLYGDRVCLIGNVNCGLLTTGTEDEMRESARYAIRHGAPGGGYVFSTSNCVFTGMPLRSYEVILEVWRREGVYPAPA
ncbi:MAG: uroporphyrinogen decarboxylase family protein [Planctomycetota bacterium]|jgi:uroporphyrinogen decarboxylase